MTFFHKRPVEKNIHRKSAKVELELEDWRNDPHKIIGSNLESQVSKQRSKKVENLWEEFKTGVSV